MCLMHCIIQKYFPLGYLIYRLFQLNLQKIYYIQNILLLQYAIIYSDSHTQDSVHIAHTIVWVVIKYTKADLSLVIKQQQLTLQNI